MVNFVMIAFCITTGMIFRYFKLIPQDAHKGINTWILYLALPAVSFKYIPKIEWSSEMLFPAISPVIVWFGSWCFVKLYAHYKNYSQRSRSTLELASGYSNTSFIGFPLIMAYFGEQDLSIAIICDQVMFVLLSTAGIICAIKGNRTDTEGIKASVLVKRLLTFPPFIGCVSAILLSRVIDLSIAEPFFEKLAATVGPLALFSVGLQLKFKGWKQQFSQISMTMLYKLMIAPALVLIIALLIGIKGDVARISIFEAAMPTLITSSIIAEQFRLNSRLINLIIGISILVGFITTAFWNIIIDLLIA
ncbi:AEC family transporter [Chryseobacterium indoltheticum]|uniref:Putative transporter YfdV n=1 Tax=Chryseobacterium indoltheticum TaxID=254 RepID=A0A381FRC1_9FLAO|nr:AEC family transporter [Chryseobacterium indoltheticum]SUX48937.1 putative transporter YfdV [Chryseobacterium indoltheticum]